MKILEIIQESRSADLYHGTSPASAEEILKSNQLTANAPIDLNALPYMRGKQKHKTLTQGELKTVSFSRSMSAARSFAGGSPRRMGITGVVFVFDQQAMWKKLGRRMTPYNDLYATSGSTKNRATEYEEMVLGDIKNVDNYIKQIFIFVHPDYQYMVDPNSFPALFNNPKTKLVINNVVKDTSSIYDRFPSRREFDKTAKPIDSIDALDT